MRILLAGYGFLGSAIAEILQRHGHALTVLRRTAAMENGMEFVRADLSAAAPWQDTRAFDAVIFCLAPVSRNNDAYSATYCTAQQNLLSCCDAGQYVFISSTAVYPEGEGSYSETGAQPHSERAALLLAAEKIALEQPGAAILRLAGLYNRDRRIYYAAPREPIQDRLIHFIHSDDAARAVLHALQIQLMGIYNVHDGNPQWRSEIFHALGFSAQLLAKEPERRIQAGKFFETGFSPAYANFAIGLQH